jgi:hypothetical protein
VPAAVLLGAALVWGVVRDAQVGFPVVPGATTLVAGAVLGALVAWLAGWLIVRIPLGATLVVVALALAVAAPGYLHRHAAAARSFDDGVSRFLADQPGYGDGTEPITAAPNLAGPLAGDRITHPLALLPGDATCARVRRAVREGYLVLRAVPSVQLRDGAVFPTAVTARRCLAGTPPIFNQDGVEVYARR